MTTNIEITLHEVPDGDGDAFMAWCEAANCTPLGSARRAWCGDFQTYLRDAVGIGETLSGETFLVFPQDIEREARDDRQE